MDLKEACERMLRGEVLEEVVSSSGVVYLWRFNAQDGFQWRGAHEAFWGNRPPYGYEAARMRVPFTPRRFGPWVEVEKWEDAEPAESNGSERLCLEPHSDGESWGVWRATKKDVGSDMIPVRRAKDDE